MLVGTRSSIARKSLMFLNSHAFIFFDEYPFVMYEQIVRCLWSPQLPPSGVSMGSMIPY